ncbi:Uncharacterized conserved protein [Gemmobacter aquatilis]|uniref:Uncharacterized conserved protein n=1 Tax=Gemmobacter aquatilis TaxID=933059 RepID=A0A1H7YZB4_9RHOB|nr:hypothetical protein [Gemmobacter aquatilis]SEM51251.1 Uncharacterized conserved protein [Gemmobacter aquatilis]
MTDQETPIAAPDTEDPKRDAIPPAETPVEPVARGGGAGRFVGLLAGGVIAAGLGFGLAAYGAREGWPLLVPQGPALEGEMAALRSQLAEVAAREPDLSRLDALETKLATLPSAVDGKRIEALEQRLAALEARPAGVGDPQALEALKAEIGTLATRLAEQQTTTTQIAAEIDSQVKAKLQSAVTEAEKLRAETVALQQTAERRAALLALDTALTTGTDPAESAARVGAVGIDLPEPLAQLVASPVSLPALQQGFADAARLALAASLQADMGDTLGDRLTTFLRTQTGARSLTPQEGDDPDAVLSRIEARLRDGDVAAAREMLGSLPAAGQAALADWGAQADRYLAGRAALSALLAN